MKGSLSLGKISGIRVQIHWTFLLIIIWVAFLEMQKGSDLSTTLLTIAFVLVIFACVVLHEFGHALAARRYGIATRKITLLPIGGIASLERMPEDPKQELVVALAGPAVNVVIALILLVFLYPFPDYSDQMEQLQSISAGNFLFYLFVTNVMLVLFNAIPAFPMDGGRVLRALLAFRMDRVRATQIAANLGQVIAIMFFFLGFFYNFWLILIGVFVYFGASGEYLMIKQLSVLRGHRVREAMMTQFTPLHPDDNLHHLAEVLLAGTERNFVVTTLERGVVGILPHQEVVRAFQQQRRDLPVYKFMRADFKAVHPDEELTEIYRKVQGQNQTFFPVVEHDQITGTIDMENINEFMMIQASLDY